MNTGKFSFLHWDHIPRESLIPFAGSQGVEATHENLFGEIEDLLGHHKQNSKRKHGHIREGVWHLLEEVKKKYKYDETIEQEKILHLQNQMDRIFENINLCGPRVFDSPKNEEIQICQLFSKYSCK